MVRSDVVHYLRENIKKFPVEDLRRQLAEEGVTDPEFDASLTEAMTLPALKPKAATSRHGGALAKILLFGGLGTIIGAAALAVLQKPDSNEARNRAGAAVPESGFVGHYGYVLRLPEGYTAVTSFKDKAKTAELVYFCKAGTDPTNFLNEGLYGQLGIVRMEVVPNPFPGNLNGVEAVANLAASRAQQRGEKYAIKNLQISTLRGVQLTYEAPFPRVEAFILGSKVLFSISAGQDDEIYRQLVESLRDARSES